MALNWVDKKNNEDVVDARDINSIAQAVIDLEKSDSANKDALGALITLETVEEVSRNRFDKAAAQSGVLDTSTGGITPNSQRVTSDFIEFENGQEYLVTRWYAGQSIVQEIPIYGLCYYDEEKNYLGYGENASSGTLYFVGAHYFKVSIVVTRLDTAMIFVGNTDVSDVTDYLEYSPPTTGEQYELNDELLKPFVEEIVSNNIAEYDKKQKHTDNLKAVYFNPQCSNDFTFVGDELWCGSINRTTNETEIIRYAVEDGGLVYKSKIVTDFGHLNTMDYDAVNDCLIFGNGANDKETVGNWFAVVPHPLALGETATLAENAIVYPVDIGYKVQAVWGDGNCGKHNIAILFANDTRTIVKVLLTKTDGAFDGELVTLDTKTLDEVIGVGGADFYGNTLYVGNNTFDTARISMTDYTVKHVTKKFYWDNGKEFDGSMQGFYINNKYEWWFFNVANEDGTASKYLLQYFR